MQPSWHWLQLCEALKRTLRIATPGLLTQRRCEIMCAALSYSICGHLLCSSIKPTHPPCSLPFKADLCGAPEPSGIQLGSASGNPNRKSEGGERLFNWRLPLKVTLKNNTLHNCSGFSNLTPSGPFSARRVAAEPMTSLSWLHSFLYKQTLPQSSYSESAKLFLVETNIGHLPLFLTPGQASTTGPSLLYGNCLPSSPIRTGVAPFLHHQWLTKKCSVKACWTMEQRETKIFTNETKFEKGKSFTEFRTLRKG